MSLLQLPWKVLSLAACLKGLYTVNLSTRIWLTKFRRIKIWLISLRKIPLALKVPLKVVSSDNYGW
jgi:hypothetical protein